MKKLFTLLAVASLLAACASSGDISATRGKNGARITNAEINQYNKQRANEVIEAQARAERTRGYATVVREGSSAVQEGVSAIKSVMSIFGKYR